MSPCIPKEAPTSDSHDLVRYEHYQNSFSLTTSQFLNRFFFLFGFVYAKQSSPCISKEDLWH